MELLLIGVMVLVLAGGGGAVYALKPKQSPRSRNLLTELGLDAADQAESPPFYRWGWHDESENRVSAERMVRQAFRKEGLWLNQDDLEFFKQQCERNINGEEIDEDDIRKKVDEIASRSGILTNWVADQIRQGIDFAVNTSPQEAHTILAKADIKAEADYAQPRLLAYEIERQLKRIGLQILGPDAQGFFLNDDRTGKVFLLQNVDAWKEVIRCYKDECEHIVALGKSKASPALLRALRGVADSGGCLRRFEQDLTGYQKFRTGMRTKTHQQELSVTPDRISQIDSFFYGWKFNESTPFSQQDHDNLRSMLMRPDLSKRFTEILIEKLGKEIQSLYQLERVFARHVLIYGGTPAARAFATDQYSRHLYTLLDVMPDGAPVNKSTPLVIEISNDEIENLRRSPKRGNKSVTLDQVIEKHQKIVSLRESIPSKDMQRRGWIIKLDINETTPEEVAAMRGEALKHFSRVNCVSAADVDFINNTYGAKKARAGFFDMVVDTLVAVPEIQGKKPAFGKQ